MDYWVNIHHPRALNESHSSQCKVYLQEKSKQQIPKNDRVFIYETEALSGKTVIKEEEDGSKERVRLGKGAKGIIALVEISGPLKKCKWIWNGTPYNGLYNTEVIKTRKNIVRLDEINKGFVDNKILKSFNPRTYTGLRKLSKDETRVFLKLVRLRHS